MKNIGLLVSSLNSGGAERVVSHLSKILSSKYHVFVILFDASLTMDYGYEGKLCNLGVAAKKGYISKFLILFQRVNRLKKIEKKESLDCVISFMDSPNFVNLFAKTVNCKRIISIRNYSFVENKTSLLGRVVNYAMKYLYREADGVISVSRAIEEDFLYYYGIPKSKLQTIYNPYNFKEIMAGKTEALSLPEQRYYEGTFVYINVSRIMYQKGIWHLIKAFSIVKKKVPKAKLVLVGEDLSCGRLTKLIRDLELEKEILLTGRVSNPYKYMGNSMVYVLTSLFEGFPNSLVEAMACGCAVIAPDCKTGPREILYKEPDLREKCGEITVADYGILIPAFNEKEEWDFKNMAKNDILLANAMIKLYSCPGLLEELQAKAIIRSHDFSFEQCKEAYCSMIEKVGNS